MSYCVFQCPYCGSFGDGTRSFAENVWDEELCKNPRCNKRYYVSVIVIKEKK